MLKDYLETIVAYEEDALRQFRETAEDSYYEIVYHYNENFTETALCETFKAVQEDIQAQNVYLTEEEYGCKVRVCEVSKLKKKKGKRADGYQTIYLDGCGLVLSIGSRGKSKWEK